MNLGTAQIIRANSRNLPLADDSVDLVMTSPPYFALRSYQDGGEHYAGQIGDEPTPAEFVDSLLEVTRECVRVLKPSGSLWVNLGDKYSATSTPGPQSQNSTMTGGRHKGVDHVMPRRLSPGAPPKSLIGIPWRYALRCIDDLGLILRAEVIWSKPNGLPESVTDRVRRSHEQWFHFTLNPRYFSAVDEIREGYAPGDQRRSTIGALRGIDPSGMAGAIKEHEAGNPLGKLPGSVWSVPTEPLRVPDHLGVDHFAAFPTEWPKRIISGWSPAGVCVECGEGRRPVVDKPSPVGIINQSERDDVLTGAKTLGATSQLSLSGGPLQRWQAVNPVTLTGYACACTNATGTGMRCGMPFENPTHASHGYGHPRIEWCPGLLPPTRPSVILDPFGGTGTTAMVAKALGRHGISVDMSADYCRLAEWRCNDRDQLAKVLGLAKVEPVAADEQSLLDLLDGGAA